MVDTPRMEIPDTVRQMAEKNIEQTRGAYSQLIEMMRKSQDMFSWSSGAMSETTREVQSKMMRFTEENLESNFRLASELARARDMKDYFEIQSRHAQLQMHNYALQAQELGRLMAEAAQKAQPKR